MLKWITCWLPEASPLSQNHCVCNRSMLNSDAKEYAGLHPLDELSYMPRGTWLQWRRVICPKRRTHGRYEVSVAETFLEAGFGSIDAHLCMFRKRHMWHTVEARGTYSILSSCSKLLCPMAVHRFIVCEHCPVFSAVPEGDVEDGVSFNWRRKNVWTYGGLFLGVTGISPLLRSCCLDFAGTLLKGNNSVPNFTDVRRLALTISLVLTLLERSLIVNQKQKKKSPLALWIILLRPIGTRSSRASTDTIVTAMSTVAPPLRKTNEPTF